MKKKLLSIMLIGILIIGLTGCGNNNAKNDSKASNNNLKENIQVQDDITSNQNDSIEQQNESNTSNINDYYTGTYYMILVDGSLADDGTGTIILNEDKSCTYIYGQSNMGCSSYDVNDHLITLKVSESSTDIYLTLDADNKMLIDANNEKYMRK